jgi:hypothetical protein
MLEYLNYPPNALAPVWVSTKRLGHHRVTKHRENPAGGHILWTAAYHRLVRCVRAAARASKQRE